MDAFEHLVSEILWAQGYWVRTSVKVALTKEEKVAIGRPSSPRWELDIVAYRGGDNSLLVVECKSYLDSQGVKFSALDGTDAKLAERFKLFNDATLREVVLGRLGRQFHECGACGPDPKITLGLAAGQIYSDVDRAKLKALFDDQGWVLWDDVWLREHLQVMATGGYENNVAAIVSKLLLRK
jgi:hypothetical protein